MKHDYLEYVKASFDFLFNNSETIVCDQVYDPDHFGNWLVTISTKLIVIKIVNDRGGITIEVRSVDESREWLDLRILINFLVGIDIVYVYPHGDINEQLFRNQLTYLADVLKKYWGEISNFLNIIDYKEAEQKYRIFQRNFVYAQLEKKAD